MNVQILMTKCFKRRKFKIMNKTGNYFLKGLRIMNKWSENILHFDLLKNAKSKSKRQGPAHGVSTLCHPLAEQVAELWTGREERRRAMCQINVEHILTLQLLLQLPLHTITTYILRIYSSIYIYVHILEASRTCQRFSFALRSLWRSARAPPPWRNTSRTGARSRKMRSS